jgi:hypothetical protein
VGDFSNYAEQGLQFGKTVPYEVAELANADGTHPLLHVEHLGAANASMMEEVLARASTEEAKPLGLAEAIRQNRDALARHCVRRLERVYFSDGTPATDADIAGFVGSMPMKAFERLLAFVVNEKNFYKYPIVEKPAALAEK